jgi:sialic acid synthase SpsE
MNKKIENIFKKNTSKNFPDEDVFIIAEIGKNFIQSEEERSVEEYLENAKNLVRLANESGADAVKFQTHNLEDEQLNIKITSPHFSGSDRYNWVQRNDNATPLYFWEEIKEYCKKLDIIFFSTPMSRGAAMKLEKVDIPLWKIGSGDLLDFVMLDFIAKTKKPIIISSGMSELKEVDKSIEFLKKRNCEIALLHCVSKYPCPSEELNLKTINFFKKRYAIPIGFSDHSIDYNSSLAAVGIGATIIEKHFSLSRNLWGSDHKVSLIPSELKEMVKRIRNKEHIVADNYGKEAKFLNEGESVFRPIFRKSLVAAKNIKEGELITKESVYAMRPQFYITGLPSEKYEEIIGKKINKNLNKYDPIEDAFLT